MAQQTDLDDRRRRILKLTTQGRQVEDTLFKEGLKKAQSTLNVFGADKLAHTLKFINDFTDEIMVKDNDQLFEKNKHKNLI